jgi:hypothetical protein
VYLAGNKVYQCSIPQIMTLRWSITFVCMLYIIYEVSILKEYSTFLISCTSASGWNPILGRNKLEQTKFFVAGLHCSANQWLKSLFGMEQIRTNKVFCHAVHFASVQAYRIVQAWPTPNVWHYVRWQVNLYILAISCRKERVVASSLDLRVNWAAGYWSPYFLNFAHR